MTAFTAPPGPGVDFGLGVIARLPERIGAARVFVVTDAGLRTAGVVEKVLEPLRGKAEVFDGVPGNPGVAVVHEGAERLRACGATVVLAVGGGSSLDAAKGIALLATNRDSNADGTGAPPHNPGVPVIAVPTTAGTGAETNGFGVLDDPVGRRKVYCGDASVAPRHTVLDPELTLGLPANITAATGVDALVHGLESLTSRGSNDFSRLYAAEAVRLAWRWLPHAVADGTDVQARAQMLLAAHLAGRALTMSGLGLVHGLGHAITAHTGAAHGLALSAVLPEVVAAALETEPVGYADAADAMSVPVRTLPDALVELLGTVGTRASPGELGCTEDMLDSLVSSALADPVSVNSPWQPSTDELANLLRRCGLHSPVPGERR